MSAGSEAEYPEGNEVLSRTGQTHGSEARVYPRVLSESEAVVSGYSGAECPGVVELSIREYCPSREQRVSECEVCAELRSDAACIQVCIRK